MSYRNRGPPNAERINEADVPESKHTVFIRGLPSSITTDEVREFFEDKVGPCNFDFVKVDPARGQLYVAIRFEGKDAARDAMNRYKDSKLFGHNVELTWFRDIRRYIAYCQKKGIRPRPARDNPRYRRRRSSRSRSKSRSRSHSKSKSRSISYSYSDRSVTRSRSRSRSSSRSASPPQEEDRYMHSEEEKKRSPSPPRKKKPKKDKKKKKKRSPSRSPSNSASDMEMSEGEINGKQDIKADKIISKKESPKTNNNNMKSILFNLDMDSNNPTIKIKKGGGWAEQAINAVNHTKSSADSDQQYKGKFIPITHEVPEPQQSQKPIKHEINITEAADVTNKASKRALSPVVDILLEEPGSALSNFRNIQKTILQEVRYKPPEIPDSPPTGGTLRLRTIQKKSPETIREEKLARLSKELREKVEKKKIALELAYRQDCETFGFVAQNLIQKDRTMEEKIRLALLESMKEMEQGILKQLDEYIDQLLFVSQ